MTDINTHGTFNQHSLATNYQHFMFNHFYIIILYYQDLHVHRYKYADVNYFGTYMYRVQTRRCELFWNYFGIGTNKTCVHVACEWSKDKSGANGLCTHMCTWCSSLVQFGCYQHGRAGMNMKECDGYSPW